MYTSKTAATIIRRTPASTRKNETATALSKGKRREVPRAQLAYLELKHVHPGLLAGIEVQSPPTHTPLSIFP